MRPKYDRISDSYGLSYRIIQSKLGYQTSLFSVSRHFSPAVWHESQVCYQSATQSSQFDVSFPKKLLKFVATRGKIFSLKFTKYHLAAGLHPDPLGELSLRDATALTRYRLRALRYGYYGKGYLKVGASPELDDRLSHTSS